MLTLLLSNLRERHAVVYIKKTPCCVCRRKTFKWGIWLCWL